MEDIPCYDENPYDNIFVNWIAKMEQIFERLRISDYERVKLGTFKLRGCAYSWWKRLQAKRKEEGKAPIDSWLMMKWLLEDEFFPL